MCPVCRENISYDLDSWLGAPEPSKDNSAFKLSDDLVLQQKQMAALLEKQRVKGGLIDLEAERNKYLISAVSHYHFFSLKIPTYFGLQQVPLFLNANI